MKPINMKVVVIVVAAFVIGCVIGGSFIQWRMSKREIYSVDNQFTSGQRQPTANQPESAGRAIPFPSSSSVIINGTRISDQDIETLSQTFRIKVKDGNYWYDRMNGSWGVQGGPAAGFILAGLKLGGPLREDASDGDTGVFINGRQLHRVDVARLMQLGPVNKGRCWMDAQGNIGLEGQPAFGNLWVAATRASGGGHKKEGILSTYDKTGIAVFGN